MKRMQIYRFFVCKYNKQVLTLRKIIISVMDNNSFCLNVVMRLHESVPHYCIAKGLDNEYFFSIHHFNDFISMYRIEVLETMHTHDFYVIVCNYEGEGIHVIDFKEYEFREGAVFFLSPGQIHMMKNVRVTNGYVISFSQGMMDLLHNRIRGSLLQDLFHRFGDISMCTLDDKAKRRMNILFKQMMEEVGNGKDLYDHADYCASLLTMLLLNLQRYGTWEKRQSTENSSSEYHVYRAFSECVDKHFRKSHSVKEYAEQLNISVSSLNKCTQQIVNLPPSRLINNRILLEAKQLLLFTSWRVKQIATELGFEDDSNFVKFFRRVSGITPAEFREMHQRYMEQRLLELDF